MYWKEFLEGKSRSTQRNYTSELAGFMEHEDCTTETLFEEHRENYRAEDPRKKKLVGSKVYRYMKVLIDEGKSTGTANNVGKTVRSFFKANELEFHINGEIKVVTSEIPIIQKDEINQILDVCGSVRLKAAIHFAKDSGMRVSDISNTEVKHLSEALMSNTDWYTWTLTQQKTHTRADPCLGPEALRWLRLWMRERDRQGIESPWLFCLVENYGDNRQVGDKMSSDTLSQLFRHYRNKAGLRETRVSIHSLRKYHKTNLEFSGVPTSWIDKLQGRAGAGSGGVYTKPNPAQLIEMYQRGYPQLATETGSTPELANQLIQQNKEIQTLTQRIQSLEAQKHNVAMDIHLDKDWVKEQALIAIKQSAEQLGLDWKTGKPPTKTPKD